MKQQKIYSQLISPAFIFLSIWAIQIIGHAFLSDDFDAFQDETWWLLAAAISAFCVGCIGASVSVRQQIAPYFSESARKIKATKLCFLVLAGFFIIYSVLPTVDMVLAAGSIAGARAAVVAGITNYDNSAVISYYVSTLVVIFSIYLVSRSYLFTKTFIALALFIGLFAAVLSSGRTLLLLLFSAVPVSLYLQGRIRLKTIAVTVLLFMAAFLLLAVIQGKGGDDIEMWDQVTWNLEVYFLNGLAAFNSFVVNNFPSFDGSLLLPNMFRRLFDIGGEPAALVLPFVETPLVGNVYTAMYPYYHDGGLLGLVCGFFGIGFFSQYLYRKRRKSSNHIFYYSVSVYALIMTVFQEQYLQAYPIWVMIFVVPALPRLGIFFFKPAIKAQIHSPG
ncbi:O-antigen polymerase [Collimonas fungivorans]|uniref:Putative O-antigen polymerase transmembrane protein n=1 Tax=Collimonas fungivorans (strain Ter331) TaxID=1005048 RepID=G0AH98_COLFT|nr:O-antigen polymerase [Collimonas fungivorans]AEK62504.1 putative O-antigen polymerase transmembrane protein [Collimonas fungivorans Ter331]